MLDAADDDLLVEALARALDKPSPVAAGGGRRARTLRATAETRLAVRLALDGASRVRVATGAGLYDHFLEQLAFHAGFDLVLEGAGDLETGDHHTAEDAALALGEALDAALGDRRGIARYGDAVVPMDDALARAAVDLGGRANAELKLELDPGLAGHMLASFAQAARASIHVEASGRDAHHVAEAAFKAVGRALRAAVRVEGAGFRRRRACCEGRDLRVRGRQRAVGRARVSPARRRADRRDVDDADLAVLPGVGSARAAMAGLRERGHDLALRERGSPRAGRSSGSASACSSRSRRPRRTAAWPGSGCFPAERCACATGRVPRMGWAEVDGAARSTSRTRTPPRRRAATAWSEGIVAEVRSGSFFGCQFHPEKSGDARRALPRGGAIPLPRLIPCLDVAGGPRRQGRPLPGAARRRRPGRARRRRTPTPARTSSSSST